MKHCMIDLETWGTIPGSALRSIGARMFDPYGSKGREFYLNITRQSCEDAGLTIDPKTVQWWAEQSDEARAALEPDQHPLHVVVAAFHSFFKANNGQYVWGHGAPFDPVLWEAASRAVHTDVPWRFGNIRDTRTWYFAHAFPVNQVKRQGTHHNALDDVNYQIDCVQAACKKKIIVPKDFPEQPMPAGRATIHRVE